MTDQSVNNDFPLTFRHCLLQDVPAMTNLSDDIFNRMYRSDYFEYATLRSEKILSLGCFSSNNNIIGFIIVIKNCVGSGFLEECSSENETALAREFDNMVGCVTTLCVSRSMQGRHIGAFLMAQVIYILRNLSISALYLHVNSHNVNAIRFYQKLGFKPHNFIKDYYAENITGGFNSRDAFIMYKSLTNSRSETL